MHLTWSSLNCSMETADTDNMPFGIDAGNRDRVELDLEPHLIDFI